MASIIESARAGYLANIDIAPVYAEWWKYDFYNFRSKIPNFTFESQIRGRFYRKKLNEVEDTAGTAVDEYGFLLDDINFFIVNPDILVWETQEGPIFFEVTSVRRLRIQEQIYGKEIFLKQISDPRDNRGEGIRLLTEDELSIKTEDGFFVILEDYIAPPVGRILTEEEESIKTEDDLYLTVDIENILSTLAILGENGEYILTQAEENLMIKEREDG